MYEILDLNLTAIIIVLENYLTFVNFLKIALVGDFKSKMHH